MKNEKNLNKQIIRKGDIWQLKDDIYYYSITNNMVLQEFYNSIKDNESDLNMMITVLLWTAPNSIFKNENNYCNSFTKFLKALTSDSFFDEEVKWFLTETNHLVFVKGEFLFILNNNKYDISSQLPDEFMNSVLHCENCNEEIEVTTFINVPAKTFYILTK